MDETEIKLKEALLLAAERAPSETGMSLPVRDGSNIRRWLVPLTTITAVIAVLVVVAISQLASPHASDTSRPVSQDGDEWVAFSGAQIELPTGWSVNDLTCSGEPRSNTIGTRYSDALLSCAAGRSPDVSDIQLWDIDNLLVQGARDHAPERILLNDGTVAWIGHHPSHDPEGYTTTTLVVPSLNLVAIGECPDSMSLDAELRTITKLPEGAMAMPFVLGQNPDVAANHLRRLGLRVNVSGDTSRVAARVTQSVPQAGISVARGSSVRLVAR
jgi:PASTA domain-containing protein